MTANASERCVGVMLSGLFCISVLVSHRCSVVCVFPALGFAAARLAYRTYDRILRTLVAKRYSKNIVLSDQKMCVRSPIVIHLLASRIDWPIDKQSAFVY